MKRSLLVLLAACRASPGGGSDAAVTPPDDGRVWDGGSVADAALDDGGTPLPPHDAGIVTPPPGDAGTPPPTLVDAGTPPPTLVDAGTPPPTLVDAGTPPPTAAGLVLVSARDHIDGYFLTPRSITADRERIYLASRFSTTLFVLARDRATNFPIIQRIEIENPGLGLTSVHVDDARVYVTTQNGDVVVFTKGASLVFESRQHLATFASDADWSAGGVVFGDGTATVAASASRVYVAGLNEGDAGRLFLQPDFRAGPAYPVPAPLERVYAFDRVSGALVGSLPAPTNLFGQLGGTAIETVDRFLAVFIPGCCGKGVELYDPTTLAPMMTIARNWASAVTMSGRYLVIGGEEGSVNLWDVDGAGPLMLATVNLRLLTGHNGFEDIEIRALWADQHDRLIFAGSSWGNDQSRSLDLPSFFVLERTGD